jgi:plastocyanin
MRLCYGLLLAPLAACGSSPSSPGGSQPPPGATVVDVSMTDNAGLTPYAFSPASVTIAAGTFVKWTNTGKVTHTSTSDATPQAVWNSGNVAAAGSSSCDPYLDPYCTPGTSPAGTYARQFNTPGTYQYHCQIHTAQGMTGTITVTP